jgi:cell wall-associated NlpC family hydrolase
MSRLLTWILIPAAWLGAAQPPAGYWDGLKAAIERHLGRPYVWGAAGMKSFDCSGFVWRVMSDNGVFLKRTTARKLYVALPPAPPAERWAFGNIVFFDDLKHCGIVDSPAAFYHAASSRGTTKSPFNPYWRRKVCAIRRMPVVPAVSPAR